MKDIMDEIFYFKNIGEEILKYNKSDADYKLVLNDIKQKYDLGLLINETFKDNPYYILYKREDESQICLLIFKSNNVLVYQCYEYHLNGISVSEKLKAQNSLMELLFSLCEFDIDSEEWKPMKSKTTIC